VNHESIHLLQLMLFLYFKVIAFQLAKIYMESPLLNVNNRCLFVLFFYFRGWGI